MSAVIIPFRAASSAIRRSSHSPEGSSITDIASAGRAWRNGPGSSSARPSILSPGLPHHRRYRYQPRYPMSTDDWVAAGVIVCVWCVCIGMVLWRLA